MIFPFLELCYLFSAGINHQKEPTSNPDGGSAQEGKKRKRGVTDTDEEADNLQHQLAKALERNGNLLSSQLEAQNAHYQLDREPEERPCQ